MWARPHQDSSKFPAMSGEGAGTWDHQGSLLRKASESLSWLCTSKYLVAGAVERVIEAWRLGPLSLSALLRLSLSLCLSSSLSLSLPPSLSPSLSGHWLWPQSCRNERRELMGRVCEAVWYYVGKGQRQLQLRPSSWSGYPHLSDLPHQPRLSPSLEGTITFQSKKARV